MIRWMPVLILLVAFLSGCVERQSAPSASSEVSASEGGIGGTGAPPSRVRIAGGDDAEGGIGGTGIFGTVTAFGSIVVNGLVVEFDEDVFVSTRATLGQGLPLTVGSAVLVEAERSSEGLIASRVALFLPIVGEVEDVDPVNFSIKIMGTTVRVDRDALLFDRRDQADGEQVSFDTLGIGDRVAVNGLWNGQEIIAERIDRLSGGGRAILRGLLLNSGADDVIGETTLSPDCCTNLSTPAFVHAEGRYVAGRFEAETVAAGQDLLFTSGLEALIVEAFLARDPDGEGFHLSGFGIPADQSVGVAAETGVRSLFIGRYDQAFRIERSLPLPGDRQDRMDALQGLDDILPAD